MEVALSLIIISILGISLDYKNTISIKTLIFEVDSELFKLIFYLSLSFVSVAAISYQLSQSVRAQAELIRAERVFDVYLDRKKELTSLILLKN